MVRLSKKWTCSLLSWWDVSRDDNKPIKPLGPNDSPKNKWSKVMVMLVLVQVLGDGICTESG